MLQNGGVFVGAGKNRQGDFGGGREEMENGQWKMDNEHRFGRKAGKPQTGTDKHRLGKDRIYMEGQD
jgi:hypothetical protein